MNTTINTFIVDIDDTILTTPKNEKGKFIYDESQPIISTIKKLQELKVAGHKIILFTARGMRTFGGDVDKIKDEHENRLIKWMADHKVPYDEMIFGKPWGSNPIYVDNRNLSLKSFLNASVEDFERLIIEENEI